MNLRPYQTQIVEATEAGFLEHKKQLIVVPTGGGKTIIFAHLAKRRFPQRTLILAHRDELIDQAIQKLYTATGVLAEKEKANDYAGRGAGVVVASVQSLMRSARLARWPHDHFGLVVIDEAHHALADSYRRILSHFDGSADVLGVTATPDRGDKRNLGEYFENIPAEVSLFDLIGQKFLSPIAIKSIPLKIDLTGVRTVAGDFNDADLGHAIEPYLAQIADAIKAHAAGRRTLVFLPLIATSQKFVAECVTAGLNAEHVDGLSDDRKDILRRFGDWDFDVLSNAMLLTEGYDDPGIDCVVVLRPTKSRPLYAQMIGRGTRIEQLKTNLLLLDFLWMHEKHRICHPAHLIAKDEAEAEQITRLAEDHAAGMGQDELELGQLATDAAHQREEALKKRLREHQDRKATTITAEEFAAQHDSLAVAEYEPVMPWERDAVTDKQAKYLAKAKIDLETVTGKGHASKLLDLYFGSRPPTFASEKAVVLMRRMAHVCHSIGIHDLSKPTAADAGRFFGELNRRKKQKETAA